jgi:hypothetical protein
MLRVKRNIEQYTFGLVAITWTWDVEPDGHSLQGSLTVACEIKPMTLRKFDPDPFWFWPVGNVQETGLGGSIPRRDNNDCNARICLLPATNPA